MARINPTRMNLINLKKGIKVASKGSDLLQRKRKVLILEFFRLLKESEDSKKKMNEELQVAYKTNAIALSYAGDFELDKASEYATESDRINTGVRNIMGVKIPEIEAIISEDMLNMMGESVAVSDVSASFNNAKKSMVEVAKMENSLKRLVIEIDKVKRRVNALEYIKIPNLKKDAKYITFSLDSMERDTFSGLKHVKKKLSKDKFGK